MTPDVAPDTLLQPLFGADPLLVAITRYQDCRAYLDELQERMARYGITQTQLADELGVYLPQVSRWFRRKGGGIPSADNIFAIERAFQTLKRRRIAEVIGGVER